MIDGVDVGSDACGGVIAAGLDGIDVSVLINNAGIFNYDGEWAVFQEDG